MLSLSSELMAVDAAEALCLKEPQVGCQVIHRFGPGVYIRECLVPAGTFVIGHHHRFPHTNVMLAGEIAMSENGSPVHIVRAPYFYVSPAGRKQGLARRDVVWQNIYATAINDVEELERWLFDKSAPFTRAADTLREGQSMSREVDRQDFFMVLDEAGISPYQARNESEREDDQIPMPEGFNVVIRQSPIEGRGVFLQVAAVAGEAIGPARIAGKRTPAGRFANHSRTPNAKFIEVGGDAILVATAQIAPYCNELVPGDEVTVDYRQALSLAGRLK